MAERDLLVRNLLRTLREGQAIVKTEVDLLHEACSIDTAQLRHLHYSVVEFAYQAKSLVGFMEEQAVDHDLIEEAREYRDFFMLAVTRTLDVASAAPR